MKNNSTYCKMHESRFGLSLILFLLGLGNCVTNAQVINQEDTIKKKTFKRTSLTFGGNGVNFTKINNQFSAMTGGSGSATFNNRFTIGGSGWGWFFPLHWLSCKLLLL